MFSVSQISRRPVRAFFLAAAFTGSAPDIEVRAERDNSDSMQGGANASLSGINPELRKVVLRARQLAKVEFRIKEGCRTSERQEMLRQKGFSNTSESKHEDGNAVDLVPVKNGMAADGDVKGFLEIRRAMMEAARERSVTITWGGGWKGFTDSYHFQLDAPYRGKYCR